MKTATSPICPDKSAAFFEITCIKVKNYQTLKEFLKFKDHCNVSCFSISSSQNTPVLNRSKTELKHDGNNDRGNDIDLFSFKTNSYN